MNKISEIKTNFETCVYNHHIEIEDSGARLVNRLLLCDELGGITSRTVEIIQGNIQAKKFFTLDAANVEAAELVIRIEGPEGSVLIVEVNGHRIEHQTMAENRSFQVETPAEDGGKIDSYWSKGWEIVPVSVENLRKGENEVILRAEGDKGWRLYIDNGFGGHSAKSVDGGKTWTTELLGHNDFCRGEYVIRLNLKRHASSGWIESPSMDLLALASDSPIAPRFKSPLPPFTKGGEIKSIELVVDDECPEGTSVEVFWRSGTTPSYRPDNWSCWQSIKQEINPFDVHHFFQWRAVLTTKSPQCTPSLKDVHVKVEFEDIQKVQPTISVSEFRNERIIRPSYTFAHQLADEPRLKILREKWRLDHVIQGGKTEFEKILRLKRWLRQQWENGWDRGTLQFVPPWDAMVVLELAGQQLSLGMCTHYSSTFAQCCLAVGITARATIISCHCVAEVWSNDFKKWVMMDPGCDTDDGRKGTRHFERNGIPMSALELHQAYANKDYEGVVEINDPEKFGGTLENNISLYRQFCATRRNNYLTSLLPEEPEHGAVSYTYDGHLWHNSIKEPLPQFSRTSRREGDFHWTLNQTVIYLQQSNEPDALDVILDTVTPNFETYLAQFDDGDWTEQSETFIWYLHKGQNTLRAKTRNAFGILGIESAVRVGVQ
ncbi:transglutaminase domain-containing protein [Candidatus Poribacteria bacterium]|nr:transglutaminase domain-containing protein [Candidatus Poribacteria bacterium]